MESKNPLRILMTADTIGGVWTYCLELMKAMSSIPVHFYFACINGAPTENQQLQLKELKNVTLFFNHLRLEWMDDCWEDVEKTEEWLRNLANLIHPDLIHLNNFTAAFENINLPVVTVFHSCVLSWWKSVKGAEAPDVWDKYRAHVTNALHKSSVIVAPSRSMLEEIQELYDVKVPVTAIYNGCNIVSFTGYKKKQPILFSMGRLWDEAKNIALFLEVSQHLDWPVYIAGDTASNFKNAYPNIHFLGKLSSQEVHQWLAKTTIYISSALYEPFGLSILEAALSGCAIVRSNIPTLQEIWGEASVAFDLNDQQGLIHVVNALIRNEENRDQMAKAAHERALEYSSTKMADKYWQIYRELLKKDYRANQVKMQMESN